MVTFWEHGILQPQGRLPSSTEYGTGILTKLNHNSWNDKNIPKHNILEMNRRQCKGWNKNQCRIIDTGTSDNSRVHCSVSLVTWKRTICSFTWSGRWGREGITEAGSYREVKEKWNRNYLPQCENRYNPGNRYFKKKKNYVNGSKGETAVTLPKCKDETTLEEKSSTSNSKIARNLIESRSK